MLYDRERGCTRPGCTAPAYRSEVHHAEKDWIVGGQTNIAELTLACKRHHRMLTNAGLEDAKKQRRPDRMDSAAAS